MSGCVVVWESDASFVLFKYYLLLMYNISTEYTANQWQSIYCPAGNSYRYILAWNSIWEFVNTADGKSHYDFSTEVSNFAISIDALRLFTFVSTAAFVMKWCSWWYPCSLFLFLVARPPFYIELSCFTCNYLSDWMKVCTLVSTIYTFL